MNKKIMSESNMEDKTTENIDIVKTDKQLDLAARALANIENTEETKQEESSPIRMVENSIANFLEQAIKVTIDSTKLSQALENSLIDSLPEMKTDEKIALFNIERSSNNDRLFKLLSPTINMITAKQQAEIQAQAKKEAQQAAVQVNVNGSAGNSLDSLVASKTSAEVETGLNALFQLLASKAKQQETTNSENN